MSQSRQDELTRLLEYAFKLPAIANMHPEPRLKRVHYDWLEAGEHTQRTVAQLSEQLRRFLDDAARQESKQIFKILGEIERQALDISSNMPAGNFMEINAASANLELLMERPLHVPVTKTSIQTKVYDARDEEGISADLLFNQIIVDRHEIIRHIQRALRSSPQVSLKDLVEKQPLKHGLAELLTYLELATSEFDVALDEEQEDTIAWESHDNIRREATLPRIVYLRLKRLG